MPKFIVEHTGKPFSSRIPEEAWFELSSHSTISAATKAIETRLGWVERGSWNDHYRVRTPDGKIMSVQQLRDIAQEKQDDRERAAWKKKMGR